MRSIGNGYVIWIGKWARVFCRGSCQGAIPPQGERGHQIAARRLQLGVRVDVVIWQGARLHVERRELARARFGVRGIRARDFGRGRGPATECGCDQNAPWTPFIFIAATPHCDRLHDLERGAVRGS